MEVTTPLHNGQAGQPVTITFLVRSHGQLIAEWGDKPVQPYLEATNQASGASFKIDARKDGAVGYYTVEPTFPSAGTWALRIKAEPLAVGTWTGTLQVHPSLSATLVLPSTGTSARFNPAPVWLLGGGIVTSIAGWLIRRSIQHQART